MTPSEAAQKVLDTCGIDSPADLVLEDLIAYYDGTVQDIELNNCDGRMVMIGGRAIVSVDKNIPSPQRRKFVLAHELGHMILHKDRKAIFSDDENSLEDYRTGSQEREANAFAAELLMPEKLFKRECNRKRFGADVLRHVSDYFGTSITAAAFRFLEYGNHPICIVHSKDGVVKYFMKSSDFPYFLLDLKGAKVPSDSVANEYYSQHRIYPKSQSDQQIFKSTWFRLSKFDTDLKMFEYCIISTVQNSVFSILWER